MLYQNFKGLERIDYELKNHEAARHTPEVIARFAMIEPSQASKKFFLLGDGGEGSVIPNRAELQRFIEVFTEHLEERMNEPTVELASEDDNTVTAEPIEIDFENE